MRLPRYAPYRETEEYDSEFMAAHALEYERKTPWTLMRLANVRELVDPRPGDRVLDLGCAAGSMTHYLSTFGCEVVGSDFAPESIEAARQLYPDLEFVQADCAAMPFADGSFDKIVAADLTEHLDDATFAAMCADCFRVLRPGGTLSIHTPNPLHAIERLKARELLLQQNSSHIGLRTRAGHERVLRDAGFEIDWSAWRPSYFPVLRQVEAIGGRAFELFRYRLCIRAAKP